jgi:hypothetical protein
MLTGMLSDGSVNLGTDDAGELLYKQISCGEKYIVFKTYR